MNRMGKLVQGSNPLGVTNLGLVIGRACITNSRVREPLNLLPISNFSTNLPPIVVPFPMRALEPWTTGEAERSPEAMVLLYRVQEAGSPMNCAA